MTPVAHRSLKRSSGELLRVAKLVVDTEAKGPGHRFAVWLQGASSDGSDSSNAAMLCHDRRGLKLSTRRLALQAILTPSIEGLSVTGGEPFDQAPAVAAMCGLARAEGLSVMVYSGHPIEALLERARKQVEIRDLLLAIDVLVDGRYERERPEFQRRWVGSTNQRIHFLTDRYRSSDPRFWENPSEHLRVGRRGLLTWGWGAAGDAVTYA